MNLARCLAVALAVAALAGCRQSQQAAQTAPPPPPAVGVQQARVDNVAPSNSFVGPIKAIDIVQLRARVEGFLEKVFFKEGQHVKTGDLLHQIEKTQYQAAVDQANANLAAAEAVQLNAQLQFARADNLVKTQAVPQTTLEQDRANLDSAKASILQNKATLAIALENLGYTDIKSPIDGRIGLTAYTQGNLVNPASGVLATIVSEDPIYVQFPVSVRQIADIMTSTIRSPAVRSISRFLFDLRTGRNIPIPASGTTSATRSISRPTRCWCAPPCPTRSDCWWTARSSRSRSGKT